MPRPDKSGLAMTFLIDSSAEFTPSLHSGQALRTAERARNDGGRTDSAKNHPLKPLDTMCFWLFIIGFCRGGFILNPPTAEQYEATRIIGCQRQISNGAVGLNFLDSKAKMDDNVVESRRP